MKFTVKSIKILISFQTGTALVKIRENNPRVVGLDGDMKNSTFSLDLRKKFPESHIECFICEQNLAGVGVGAACR